MVYPVSPQAYDRAITVFSPDGRLFQVEYAKEAVKLGATTIGATSTKGVVLVAYKNIQSKLLMPESLKKIFIIDEHVAATASGLVADARRLIDIARTEVQHYKVLYDEAPYVESVTRNVCDMMQMYTQFGGARPFGVSLLVAGVDSEPRLFEAEPSGALLGYKAVAIGSGKKVVEEIFEKHYRENMTVDELINLCIKALKKSEEGELTTSNVEIAFASAEEKKFSMLPENEIKKYLKS